jgi:hypothetical protein
MKRNGRRGRQGVSKRCGKEEVRGLVHSYLLEDEDSDLWHGEPGQL